MFGVKQVKAHAADNSAVRPTLIETRALSKRYQGGTNAVDGLDMTVLRGEVYGMLGPNGAGKTTTLRMLLGLIRPTSGAIRVMGEEPGSAVGLARVGALVESPAFYPHLSGRDNLRVMAGHARVPAARVEATLAQVDMYERAKYPFKTYSTGMKQRLGVAAALLKDPELLILDEPTSGLDPKGMAELRDLIQSLGQEDRTVLLSSHLLFEVEQICDRVGVIQRGRLVAEGPLDELRGPGALLVRAEPLDLARQIVTRELGATQSRETDGALRISTDPANAAALARALITSGVEISELRPIQHSLEEVFLSLTQTVEETEDVPHGS